MTTPNNFTSQNLNGSTSKQQQFDDLEHSLNEYISSKPEGCPSDVIEDVLARLAIYYPQWYNHLQVLVIFDNLDHPLFEGENSVESIKIKLKSDGVDNPTLSIIDLKTKIMINCDEWMSGL